MQATISLVHPEKGRFCHQLVINEDFESRARKFAKRRFFQTFDIITKSLKADGQLNEPLKESDAAVYCLPKIQTQSLI